MLAHSDERPSIGGGLFCFPVKPGKGTAMADKWRHGQNWWVQTPTGERVNLNSEGGANYVLELQEQLAERESGGKRRGTSKRPGPSETKRGA